MKRIQIVQKEGFWEPNPGGQRGFMDDYTHRYCAIAGGWFAGKTWAGARKLADLHVLNAFDAGEQPTAVRGLIVAPTYGVAMAVDVPEMCAALSGMGLSFRFISDPRNMRFKLPDLGTESRPSEILVRTAEEPRLITGFSVGHIWGDEVARWRSSETDPTDDALLQADGRLRDPRANLLQFTMTFTHEGDATQVYRDFEAHPKPDHVLYRASTWQNPLAQQFAQTQIKQLTEDLQEQYLHGKARTIRGAMLYGSFDSDRNLDPSLALEEKLPLQLAVDFNIEPGMHAILGQHFPQRDFLTSVHEIHESRMDVRRMIFQLRRLIEELGGWKWPELQVFGDATGQGKWAGSGSSCYEMLAEALSQAGIRYSLKVPRSNPLVVDRVNAVNCALANLDGRVRYKIHPRCARLIEDFRAMRWKAGGPDKRDADRSHASDADGYRVHWLMPIRKVRWTDSPVGVV